MVLLCTYINLNLTGKNEVPVTVQSGDESTTDLFDISMSTMHMHFISMPAPARPVQRILLSGEPGPPLVLIVGF